MKHIFHKYTWSKYVATLLITVGIFSIGVVLSGFFDRKKIENIRIIQDKVATDISSIETQFDTTKTSVCEEKENFLSSELSTLAERITYAEESGMSQKEVLELKKQYSILQVKDFILAKRVASQCNNMPVTILYFYTDKAICSDCVKQGYVLDAIKGTNKNVRIYSFDSRLDLATIQTLKNVYDVKAALPALVVDGVTLTGFQSIEAVRALLPVTVSEV